MPTRLLPVRAVIALYSPTDMRLWGTSKDNPVTELLGGPARDLAERYADASPVEFARDGLPSTLLI